MEWEGNMPDVFISYSHKDSAYAHQLAEALRRQGLDVWIDDRIDYGEHWPRIIQENLTSCRIFVVVMSTNAFNSTWVQNEVSFAQESNKLIFPLLLEGRVWLSLASMQYVDVRSGAMPSQKFADRLKAALQQPVSAVAPSKANAPIRVRTSQTNLLSWFFMGGALLLVAVVGIVVLYSLLRPGGLLSPLPSPTPVPPTNTALPPTLSPTDPPVIDKPLPEPPTKPPVITDLYPPDPLGPQYTGMWFSAAACNDMDALLSIDTTQTCDLYLQASAAMLEPINGALITGYATSHPPSLNTCQAVALGAAPVAVQTDAYLCFLTNERRYGFIVVREHGDMGITYDAYVFPFTD
jgi:hypothetical protein